MISVEEALRLVLQHAVALPPVRVPVRETLGCILAEDVASDIDSPPWDKSMVDGYAICAADLASGDAELEILEEVVAGAVPTHAVRQGTATRIMTGAPIPVGADAIVMIERAQLKTVGRVKLHDAPARVGQNILRQGSAFQRGDVILSQSRIVRPVHIGLMCEVGCNEPLVVPRPRVAVLSTGNELVAASQTPQPGQIRNSNGPMLTASVEYLKATPIELGVARDEADDLRQLIAAGLEADVLLLSGGVSAGVLDLVPTILAELGVQQVFHKVRLKPGKPLWFGVLNKNQKNTLVFGLPGNPVSSLVGFELFVSPAISKLAGYGYWKHELKAVRLESEFHHRGDRPTYYPALVTGAGKSDSDLPVATLLTWQGSADLCSLGEATALVVFPAGEKVYRAGDQVEVFRL